MYLFYKENRTILGALQKLLQVIEYAGSTRIREADMRRIKMKPASPLRSNSERRAVNAMLRNFLRKVLLDHCQGCLRERIERGNRLGIRRVRLLRHDQLGKFSRDIHIGLFDIAANHFAPPAR